jgi:hypothetical protein
LPSGSEWVSASSRPMTVLFPWSTWPTITMFIRCAANAGAETSGSWGTMVDDILV